MTGRGLAYCLGPTKRAFDCGIAAAGLLLLAPLLAALSLLILMASGGPILFIQERIGLDGRPFLLLKFRTMRRDGPAGLPITGSGDPRVTRIGRLLRATKLDELPQLVNVLRGEMSVVGPRPEVPRYVAGYTPEQRGALRVRPGLTDAATVLFRDEEALLAAKSDGLRERYYIEEILPRKIRMHLDYIDQATLGGDLGLILRTVRAILLPARA